MKAATLTCFSIDKKYEKFDRLILAYVWHVEDPARTLTYALSYQETLDVATQMAWTETESWRVGGRTRPTRRSSRLQKMLDPYLMGEGAWQTKGKDSFG